MNIASILKMHNPVNVPFGKPLPAQHVLVLSPHPDDEILGCGGILSEYQINSVACTVIYLTDGRYGTNAKSSIRIKEAQSIRKILKGIDQIFWNLPDSGLHEKIGFISYFLKKNIEKTNPDIIFTPWILDFHIDHESTSKALAIVLQSIEFKGIIAFYEVTTPLLGNYLFNISCFRKMKKKLIKNYLSQIRRYHVDKMISHLNYYRAIPFRRRVTSAECFLILNKTAYVKFVEKIYA
jgi:LmbE family N-acetylglucosaminyl deacetylase